MSAMTFAEKALARASGRSYVAAGEIVTIQPDVLLSHDNSAAIIQLFHQMGGTRLFAPTRHVIVLDHAAPAPTTLHAENHKLIREFVLEQELEHFFDIGRGICHQVLVEEGLSLPGELVLGADSHTPHAGVMGAFGAGIGRSEMASTWALGELWLRVPESLRITLHGTLEPGVTSKDLALTVIGQLGADGALYQSVEWCGETLNGISIEQRATLPNMMAEMGAKNSYLPPDDAVIEYLEGRAQRKYEPLHPDPGARYAHSIELDAGAVEPMVACPHTVDNVKGLHEVQGTRIQQAFIGTCTNGRYEDLVAAAGILRGRRVAPGVRLIIIPASAEVYVRIAEEGILLELLQAGAVLESPGCGPCMGNHMGVPAKGEVTISTANRNFRGRMGTKESEIYLASPEVVAAAAIAGEICHPRDILQ
jgi:3-isopropylmalate/(R)-2-methylmalate dehydratase large subunit